MKSIPTHYNGTTFRSRLEARWAVFFDALEIPWLYEPTPIDLGDGDLYLCDFHLPSVRLWLEIKPAHPTAAEIEKCRQLAQQVPDDVRILCGPIGWWRWRDWGIGATAGGVGFHAEQHPDGERIGAVDTDAIYCPCLCPVCGLFGVEYQGRAARLRCRHVEDERVKTGDAPRIVAAISIANAAQLDYEFTRGGC